MCSGPNLPHLSRSSKLQNRSRKPVSGYESRHVSAIEQRYKTNALPYNIIYLTHDAKRSQNHHHHHDH